MVRDVTDLEVYMLSLELLRPVYTLTKGLPFEYRRIKLQLNGAAEAIGPLIAEGFGKKKAPKEFCRFLSMALGSSDEVVAHIREIIIIREQNNIIITKEECELLIEKYKILSKKLNKLHSAWQKFS